ncbi:MAG: TonB-dependent receptor [Casimicrobiaceae bacterium]
MNPSPLSRAALCVAPLLLSAPAHAQPVLLDPVVVTATRIPQPVSSLLSDVRIIGRDEIAAAGNQSLLELLQAAGGVEIAANGGPGQPGAVFIRGANANHVVLLIDGVRINSATAGTNAFENIPLDQIERIEMVRGPASGLYGADAIGGVIQIFTRSSGNRTSLSGGAGTWNTQRYTASLAREWGVTRINIQGGYGESRAFSATNERNVFSFNPDTDPYRNRHGGATLSHAWAPGQEIVLRALASEGTTHFDSGLGSDDINRQRLSSYAVESRNKVNDTWSSVLRFARGADDIATSGSFPSTFRTDQDQATWQNDIAAPGGKVAAGLEYRRERVESTTEFSQTGRSIRAVFAGYSGAFGANLLQAALRYDHNSQFGGRTTGNFGYGYRLTPAWRISASAGTAFKAPSFNDLYFVSPFFSGNPDLKPERSNSHEAALNYDDGSQRAGLSVFDNRIRDLIAVDSSFTTVVNVNEARIRGATLTFGIDAGNHRLKAEITRENPLDEATGKLLVRRAKTFGSLSINGNAGAWHWGAQLVGSGERFDSAANSAASRLAGYGLLNLRLAYAVAPQYTVSLRWNNVLNKSYELVRGYNTPQSNFFAMLEYSAE